MRKVFSLFLLLLISTIHVICQNDFKKGFIITNTNDTINGLIDFKSDRKSTIKCTFKKTENEAAIVYYPNTIKGYRINEGKYYVSRYIKIDTSSRYIFVEFLVNGIANLYYFKDDRGEHFLLERKRGELVELNETKKIVAYKGDNYESTDKKFIGRLKLEFNDAPDLFPEIENSSFTKKSMMKVVEDYHQKICKDQKCIEFEKKFKKILFNFGIVVGLNYDKFIIPKNILITDQDSYLKNGKFDTNSHLSIGGYSNISIPEVNDFFSLQYEINYSRLKHVGEFIDILSIPLHKHTQKMVFTTNSLHHIIMINYNLLCYKTTPTIHIGFFINQIISQTGTIRSISYDANNIQNETTLNNQLLSNISGLILGLGLKTSSFGNRSIRTEILYQYNNSLIIEPWHRGLSESTISFNILFDLTKTKKN